MFPAVLRELRQRVLEGPRRASVGIDVGRTGLRVVALRRRADGVALAGLASTAFDAGASDAEGPLARAAIHRACRYLSWHPRRVVLGVPAEALLVRTLDLPAGSGTEEAAYEVERAVRLLPVPVNELRVAWVALPSQSVAPAPTSVMMVAARREPVLERQRLARLFGLGRAVVDVDALAAMRALGHASGLPDTPPQLLVDAGSESVRVMSLAPGRAPVLRVVPAPGSGLAADLARSVAAVVGELATASSALMLTGGRVLADGVADAIAERTGLPCSVASPFSGLGVESHVEGVPSGASAGLWLVAVGLALRGLA